MFKLKYTTDIKVIIENGKEKTEHLFNNEIVDITRATKLWIRNESNGGSEFYENVKLWHGIDEDTKTKSYYSINPTSSTPVESFRKYFVTKVDEEDQSITFEWNGY